MKLPTRFSRATSASSTPPRPGSDGDGDGGGGTRSTSGLGTRSALIGIALVLMGAGMLLVSTAFERGAAARVAGDNAPVNAGARAVGDINAHNSPALVANPRNAANLVIANKIDSPRFSCALHVSFDGGVHWSQTPIPLPAGEEPKCYAPDVTFAADGALYLSFVTLKGRGNVPNAVWLVRSSDGGQTLSEPTRVQGRLKFQVRLAADPASPQRLYMTWLDARQVGLFRFAEPGNPIRAARSDDGGRTWSAPVDINPPARTRVVAPSPAVGPQGQLYVLYLDLGEDVLDYEGGHRGRGGAPYAGNWKLVMARSADRGVSWDESLLDDELVPTERFVVFTPPYPSLAVDRRSGTLYAAFHDGRRGNPDAYLWRLGSGAGGWSKAKRINDTPASDDSSQSLPKLSVSPDGRLDAMYLDRRSDPADVMTEVSLQASYDRGESFLARLRLSNRRFDSRIGYGAERGMPDLGNRLGLISTRERALGIWTDTRGGTRTTGKQDLARGLAAFSAPEDMSSTLKALLRILGALLVLTGLALIVRAARKRRGGDREARPRRTLRPRSRQAA